ncbi:hypothetical protein GC722_09015 [Auraticoccus sp. F435]|uniref:Uncharacterized protein n=1 Tax=Auraticoccus cholistanensis TaxID=2656650 RepID=A0A6A9UWZ0_9ACTN|nr:hypothetical protein [Auraticoccus cholistanensis]MVA76162.1 hypothetical protein [Auraticoccus cholistanensis]
MISRLATTDAAEAAELVGTLTAAGWAADVVTEPADGGRQHVVQTDAPVELLQELVGEGGPRLEVSDPMSGVSAPVPPDEVR